MKHPYAELVQEVAKPARYLGGEYLQRVKPTGPGSPVEVTFCLAFPDVYDVGMSHLGTKIIYSLLNKEPRIACERAFAPWADMEERLRARKLPLVSLESARPLAEFDVIGMSLQYEMTYTNCLLLLDLAGLPLRSCHRTEAMPLVLAGGPTATHPEPVAPFFDAFLIGEAEEVLPGLLVDYKAMRRAGRSKLDTLAELAARGALYVPALYDTEIEPETGALVVAAPRDPRAPRRVTRAMVANLDRYPFPTDFPVPHAEAIFDRASIEIARGCTEGCRFCQAGMIYRPVRERSPAAIVQAVEEHVTRSGYDEVSLTCLSTADYSCITPLVHTVMESLRDRKVALSVSSLRAYGLNDELLEDMASVRAGGLTFAPEAGTQRMRDVVNKNVTEEHIKDSAERIFKKGFSRAKLYCMIGLPTETDDDVKGIVQTGSRVETRSRQIARRASITLSVSCHVPKPHTPFQWCAMDPLPELERKQRLLRDLASSARLPLKWHDAATSEIEAICARGDRRIGDVIEAAYRRGARFDGWDELFDAARWTQAFADAGVDPQRYLGTIPVTARLPWDHLDVGLADGFLLREYRKALKDRLSPPCGKPFGRLLHHTNLREAEADTKKLVCYDCGVACDLSQMREERLTYLRTLGALEPTVPTAPAAATDGANREPAPPRRPQPTARFRQSEGMRYRLRYTKLGRTAYLGHLDVMRLLGRTLRRAGLGLIYTQGFHPKPWMTLGPALGLGIASLGELCELKLAEDPGETALRERLAPCTPDGFEVISVRRVPGDEPGLARLVAASDLLLGVARSALLAIGGEAGFAGRIDRLLAGDALPVLRVARDREAKSIEVPRFVRSAELLDLAAAAPFLRALDWPEGLVLARVRVKIEAEGSVKPSEVVQALLGREPPGTFLARLGLVGLDAAGAAFDPLDLATARRVTCQPPQPGAPRECRISAEAMDP